MSEFKFSSYVHECELDGRQLLLANYLWRTFAALDAADAQVFLAARTANDPRMFTKSLAARLYEYCMLIDANFDEGKFISRKYDDNRFSDRVLGLTIAPTLDCNFRCIYCYEDKRPGRMSHEIEDAIIAHVRSNLPSKVKFNVVWYGGEPLLCKETIYRLTDVFLEENERCGTKYSAFMVTNGYLLTPEVVDQLASYGHWSGVQLTLDGHAATHDAKRKTLGGKPTFEVIWNNLRYAASHFPMVLRMNVDLLNPSGCHDLLDLLAEAQCAETGLRVYFAPIHPYGKGCRDIQEKESLQVVDNRQFADTEVALVKHAIALGFKTRLRMDGPRLTQCQAVSTHTIILEPDGSFQRCWVELGEEDKRVGHIMQPIELTSDKNMRWLRFDPTRNDPCRGCKVLPLCFGGCPHRHINGAPEEYTCNEIRYNVKEMVLLDYFNKHNNGRSAVTSGGVHVCTRYGSCGSSSDCPRYVRTPMFWFKNPYGGAHDVEYR